MSQLPEGSPTKETKPKKTKKPRAQRIMEKIEESLKNDGKREGREVIEPSTKFQKMMGKLGNKLNHSQPETFLKTGHLNRAVMYTSYYHSSNNPQVFITFAHAKTIATLYFEIFQDVLERGCVGPNAAENFIRFCVGSGDYLTRRNQKACYVGTSFHKLSISLSFSFVGRMRVCRVPCAVCRGFAVRPWACNAGFASSLSSSFFPFMSFIWMFDTPHIELESRLFAEGLSREGIFQVTERRESYLEINEG